MTALISAAVALDHCSTFKVLTLQHFESASCSTCYSTYWDYWSTLRVLTLQHFFQHLPGFFPALSVCTLP